LALLYLATGLRDRGFEVSVFDRDAYAGGLQELADRVVDYKPDVVGMPLFTTSPAFRDTQSLIQELTDRLPTAKLLCGGPHASACPTQTLEWFPDLDFVLQGEADHTICELMEQLTSNVARPEVAGLHYRDGGEIVSIPVGKAPKDLDAIPIPDRKIIWENYSNGVYWRADKKGATDYIISSRGCPFNCNFCFKIERGYRTRSPENVVAELEYLATLGIKSIEFEDDLFTADKSRCLKICDMIQSADLGLHLKVRSRVDTIDADILSELRKCGVKSVVYGFESGSQTVLDAMNKRANVKRNYEVVRMTKKAGLACYADLFVGFPGETPETLVETEKFLLKAKPTALNLSALIPFPGTQVYNQAKADGMLVGDWSLDGPQPWVKLPWMKSFDDLREHQRRIRRRFYSNPSVFLGMLKDSPSKFSLRTWGAGFRFIRGILKR
jgi:radical SAM superfamily enzyme YgiQ (UPF0313 family)